MFLRILNRSESVFLRLLAKSRDIDHLRLAGIVLLAAAALLSAQKTVFGDEYPIGKTTGFNRFLLANSETKNLIAESPEISRQNSNAASVPFVSDDESVRQDQDLISPNMKPLSQESETASLGTELENTRPAISESAKEAGKADEFSAAQTSSPENQPSQSSPGQLESERTEFAAERVSHGENGSFVHSDPAVNEMNSSSEKETSEENGENSQVSVSDSDAFYRIPTSFPASKAGELPIHSREGIPLYLLKQNGNLVAVPGIHLEFMDQVLRTVRENSPEGGLMPKLPDFVFHSILADGYAEQEVMRMRVRFMIETFDETPVSVPLKFNEGILLGTPSGNTESKLFSNPPIDQSPESPSPELPSADGENASENPDSNHEAEEKTELEQPSAKKRDANTEEGTADEKNVGNSSGESDEKLPNEEQKINQQNGHIHDSTPLTLAAASEKSAITSGVLSTSESVPAMRNSSETSLPKSEVFAPESSAAQISAVKTTKETLSAPADKESVPAEEVSRQAVSSAERESAEVKNVKSEKDSALEDFYADLAKKMTGSIPVERKYSGPGNVWVDFSTQNGFTAWITGKGIHEIELTFLVPFVRSPSGEVQFQVQFPYATMSELKIHIPQTRLESERLLVSMTGGTTLQPPYFESSRHDSEDLEKNTNSKNEPGRTCVSAIRLGGEFWMTWSVSPQEKTVTPDILDVESLILAGIDKEAVTYDARLKVTRKDTSVTSFRLRLPQKAELQPQNTPEYSIVYVQEKNASSETPLAEVTLKNSLARQIRVDVHAKVPIPSERSMPEWFNMAGFEVLSAVRQSGYYAIKTSSGRHANWTPGAGMRRLEELPVPLELWTPVKNLDSIPSPNTPIFSENPSNEIASGSPNTLLKHTADKGKAKELSAEKVVSPLFNEKDSSNTDSAEEVSQSVIEETPNLPENPYLSQNENETLETGDWGKAEGTPNFWDSVFEFDSQPTPLWTRIVEKTTRVNIEPKYLVTVQEDKLLLEATWNCAIRGGKISWIDIDLNGWTFLSCTSESLVAVDRINDISSPDSEFSVLSLPFNQPTGNHITLTFKAERPISGENGIFQFELPQKFEETAAPVVFTNSPARLWITAPANLEIVPTRQCRRLIRQPLPDSLKEQIIEGATHLLYQCESEKSYFEANMKLHERQTRIKQFSSIELTRREYLVSQKFEYSVSYEKLDSLHFLVPEMDIETLSISLNGNDLSGDSKSRKQLVMKPALRPHFSTTALNSSLVNEEYSDTLALEASETSVLPETDPDNQKIQQESGASSLSENNIPYGNSSESVPQESSDHAENMSPAETPVISSPFPRGENENNSLILKFRPSRVRQQFMEVEAILPEEKIGTFMVSISYSIPMVKLEQEKPQLIDLLLATSEDGMTIENLAEIKTSENLELISPKQTDLESPWDEIESENLFSSSVSSRGNLPETSQNLLPKILCKSVCAQNTLQVQIKNHVVFTREMTIIERCWLQTWLTGNKRQDRAVFLFPQEISSNTFDSSGNPVGRSHTIRIHLPGNASADSAEIWINRKPAILGNEIKRLSGNILQVTYSSPADSKQAPTVEIRYQFEESVSTDSLNMIEIPYVEEAVWVRGIYWQLLLPQNIHLFQAPKGFSMEYRWGWNQCFVGRLPIWGQRVLERWSGALEGTPAPLKMNSYVLAGMGTSDSLNAHGGLLFLNRTTIIVCLTLFIFGAGCLVIYFPIFQKPYFRIVICVLLAGIAFRFPEFALLGFQAAVLGMILFFSSMMFGLRQKMRRKMYVSEQIEDQTVHQPVPQTVITPSENSSHAFKTVTYEQSLGVSDENQSTVARKS